MLIVMAVIRASPVTAVKSFPMLSVELGQVARKFAETPAARAG